MVNFYGGPGLGKSTLVSEIFVVLKKTIGECEITKEFMKDKVWEGTHNIFKKDQLSIFADHNRQLMNLDGKVPIVLVDSPLLSSILYDYEHSENFTNIIVEKYSKYNNLNLFLLRNDDYYKNTGRYQNLDEAKELDIELENILIKQNVDFKYIENMNINSIVDHIIDSFKKLNNIKGFINLDEL